VTFHIRAGRLDDFEYLKQIEIDAFETLFAAGGVCGEASSSTHAELQHYIDAGFLIVAADEQDQPIGYVGAILGGGWLHVSEIDVAPVWQRKGVGRSLMSAVLEEGRIRGVVAATLTTDRFVPFNAPFYASLGFCVVADDELPDRLREILSSEHAAGFDPARRVVMKFTYS
jgi:predicted N-acetyltransferase YhbS